MFMWHCIGKRERGVFLTECPSAFRFLLSFKISTLFISLRVGKIEREWAGVFICTRWDANPLFKTRNICIAVKVFMPVKEEMNVTGGL